MIIRGIFMISRYFHDFLKYVRDYLRYFHDFKVLGVLCLVVAASGQGDRRERRLRLQKLISKAKGGDIEAQKTLKNLRSKLKARNKASSSRAPEPATQAPAPAPPIQVRRRKMVPVTPGPHTS